MAAAVEIHELNGAGETGTNKTAGTIRFKMVDDATVNLSDPVVVPSSGTAYSMQKWVRMYVSGTYTQISDVRLYTDGNNGYGTGCKLWVKTAAAYATPAIPSTSNDPPQLSGANMVDAFTYTSGSPLDIDALNAGPFSGTGYKGDYAVLVFEVETTASQGLKTAETITIAWDEIWMFDPMPFEINGSGITAVGSDVSPRVTCTCGRSIDSPGVLVAFAGDGDAKMFRRRAQRMTIGGATEHIEMLVAELNGVRTYLQRDQNGRVNIVVSTLDLVP